MESEDIEWAAFFFSAMGVDIAYIKYLIERIKKDKDHSLGNSVVEFLDI